MKVEMLDISQVELDEDNPRLANFLELYGEEVTEEHVAFALDDSGNSKNTLATLREAIKANGGLITPIIVNRTHEKTTVIEGNTRVNIYQEFAKDNVKGDWSTIPAVVYEDMTEEDIHAVRLQAHLVGPRDWEPYAKAKYLYELSTVSSLTDAQIEDFCGGTASRSEVRKLVDAYIAMEKYYRPLLESDDRFDTKKFSYFAEMQNKSRLNSLWSVGKTLEDFASWVIAGKVDSAQNVRDLSKILQSPEVASNFLSDPSMTVSEAREKIVLLSGGSNGKTLLAEAPLNDLVIALTERLANFPYSDYKQLRENPDSPEVDNFRNLNDFLIDLISDITEE